MKLTTAIETLFKKYLPSPFTIAVLLTFLTIIIAYFFTDSATNQNHLISILTYWEKGVWDNALLVFAYQMMLILVLGHVLVLSAPVTQLIDKILRFVTNTANAAALVSATTMLVSFFNWGLGLIFGAIFARKVAEYAQAKNIAINYPLIGASGYVGLMVWHGGISGSAPLKVAEGNHLKALMQGVSTPEVLNKLPESIATSTTVLSSWNLLLFAVLLLLVPGMFYWLGKKVSVKPVKLKAYKIGVLKSDRAKGAEKLETSKIAALLFGGLILMAFFAQYTNLITTLTITPNMLNLFMFGVAILLHGSFKHFLKALEEAIKGTSGILIQFPLYFGIMGVMSSSGLIQDISSFFSEVATATTLPIFTFFSAGLVNIFVPSGGGQWAVQGPIVVESALQLGVPLPKAIMALAYGDQITNMLQPFWALPLLGITKLKAKEILPYTLLAMLVGTIVFLVGLLLI